MPPPFRYNQKLRGGKIGFELQQIAPQYFIYFTFYMKVVLFICGSNFIADFFLKSLKNINAVKVKMDEKIIALFSLIFSNYS